MLAKISRSSGTALVEILIVIVMSSLLIGLFLHADLAVNRSILRWVHRSGLEQASIKLSKQLRRDISGADSIYAHESGDIDIFCSNSCVVNYSFRDSTVRRDKRILLPTPVSLHEVTLSPLHSDEIMKSFTPPGTKINKMVLTVVLRRDDFATQTLIMPIRPLVSRQIE